MESAISAASIPDPGPGSAAFGPSLHTDTLRERYESYRRNQGRELLDLLPAEGLRGILRYLRDGAWPSDQRLEGSTSGLDDVVTLEDLARRCADLLPLPPFEVWAEDFHRSRSAYESQPGPPLAPRSEDGRPVTVAVRTIGYEGVAWVAGLGLRPQDPLWVGHVRFHPAGDPEFVQTGDILREGSPEEVRRRFADFDDRTLEALLRSVLP